MFDWTFNVESERLIAMSVSLSIDLPLLSDVTESVLTGGACSGSGDLTFDFLSYVVSPS